MLIDLRDDGPELLQADVAIAGSGAAGIVLARSLLDKGLSVVLLESGGLDYEAETAALNRGVNIGQPYYDLERSRLRFFGGTTAIWGGRCAELDAIDFQARAWVPHSGWPISFDELQPWVVEARRLLGVDQEGDPASPELLRPFDGLDLVVRHWRFDADADRFGAAKNLDLIDHPRAQVAIYATVREIVPAHDLNAVDHLEVRSPSGKTHRVKAQTYVLAAGGLENPRILLASNSVMPAGVGNQHDLVGRYFMEHPHARGGRIVGAPVWRLLQAFRGKRIGSLQTAPLITLSEDSQRREGALNSALTIVARPPASGRQALGKKTYEFVKHKTAPTGRGRALWRLYRGFRRAKRPLTSVTSVLRCYSGSKDPSLVIRAEQAPNPDSRVLLSRETDAMGIPQIALDWRLTRQDVDSVAALVKTFAAQAERVGLGRVETADWLQSGSGEWVTDPLISAHPLGGYHHMGTTRMADDPKKGVTDRWGRVHGLANLYVAGSSLFPTSGWANPTLSIIALALRTADHIASRKS